jgi:acyl-CoA synthetase (AMP-forming)/AMP-acid ligase II
MTIQEIIISSYLSVMPATDLPKPTSYHQLFWHRAQTIPDAPYFFYPEPVAAEEYRILTYKGADNLISHLAARYSEILPERKESTISRAAPKSLTEPPMVIATLASNKAQLVLTGLAAQRMQHAFVHMTPLNSDAGIVSLLNAVDARVLLADKIFYERAEKLAAQVENLKLVPMIEFDPLDELKKELKTFGFDLNKDESQNSTIIFHTSGTSNGLMFVPPFGFRKITLTSGLM